MRWAALACLLAACAVLTAVWSTREALEERQASAEAVDLRLALLLATTGDVLDSDSGGPSEKDLLFADGELNRNHELALHSLEPEQRERTLVLLDDVANSNHTLLHVETEPHDPRDHDELQRLLGIATEKASEDSNSAERNAAAATLFALVSLGFAGWLLTRTHYRAEQERSVNQAQLNAGRQLEVLLNDSPDIYFVISSAGEITYRSDTASRLLGLGATRTQHVLELVTEVDRDRLSTHLAPTESGRTSATFEVTDLEGQVSWFDIRVSDLLDHELVHGRLITARDVTNEVRLRDELRSQVTTDLLTGLPNRRALQPNLDEAKASMNATGHAMAFMTLDLDGFKSVNDTLGHHAGDELLAMIASRLRTVIRPDETLLRLGGDEFGMILPNVSGPAEAKMAAHRLLAVLDEPFPIGDRTEHLRTSIGVALALDPDEVESMMAKADTAMYASKRQGGHAVTIYHPSMELGANRGSRITRALRRADFDTEFSLVYQPIVDAVTTEIVGLEALLRWTSPTIGPIGPDEFIPLAEASGEIVAIGQWVLNAACHQRAFWNDAGVDPHLTVSVNVSPRELAVESFVSSVIATAAAWSVQPSQLVLEVTESVMLDDRSMATKRLEKLRQAGFRISIDDFGSGYSNLGQLMSIPFDIIKIDRSLLLTLTELREGGDASGPCAIMESIVSIAKVLDAPVICEGVETETQRASLVASGVSHMQGYLTGRPVSPELITSRLLVGVG